jgi:hypothetical protein
MNVDHGQFGLACGLDHVSSEPRRRRFESGGDAMLHHEYDLHSCSLAERYQPPHEEA